MNIQWYPGHMAKTKRAIVEKIKQVDVVVELLDARLPRSSRNPSIGEILAHKPHIVALNKSDIADKRLTEDWVLWYRQKGINAVPICSVTGKGIAQLKSGINTLMSEKIQHSAARGMSGRLLKLMVVGIPNVGKSAFINRLIGRGSAETGDRPGVTRNTQWFRIDGGYELMDTPGILWPKFEDERTALNLAFTGAIKDEIMDIEELAANLCDVLKKSYPQNLCDRYKLHDISADLGNMAGHEILGQIASRRGCLVSGGQVDTHRAANILLDEFRGAKIGRITLEEP